MGRGDQPQHIYQSDDFPNTHALRLVFDTAAVRKIYSRTTLTSPFAAS